MDFKDIGIRAAKTAAQTFLAVIIPALTVDALDKLTAVLAAAGIAALAAALSVLNNALIASLK